MAQSLVSPPKKQAIVAACIFAVMACGVLFLAWKDIYAEVPKLEQLQELRANGFRVDKAREVYNPMAYSMEFYDKAGKRYQIAGMEKPEFDRIAAALSSNEPVVLRYGKWHAVFPSDKIFTVYQVEVGQQVVIPYSRLASARQREQSGGPLIMLSSILAVGLVIWFGVRRQMRFQRQLEIVRNRNKSTKVSSQFHER